MAVQMQDGSLRCTNLEGGKECGKINPQGESYCEECGTKLEIETAPAAAQAQQQAQTPVVAPPVVAPPPVAAPTPPPQQVTPKAVTLNVKDGAEIDVQVGASILIARHDTDKCQPDVALQDPRSSSTPITVTGIGKGKVRVSDPGTTNGFMVLKYYNPGTADQPTEVELGIGDTLIIIKQAISME